MQTLQYATSFLAISQLLFMVLFYIAYYRRQTLGRLMAFYGCCLIAYILATLPEMDQAPFGIDFILTTLAITAPSLLWIITRYLFDDSPSISLPLWIVIGGYILLSIVGRLLVTFGSVPTGLPYLIFRFIPQIIMLAFSCHVIYTAVTGLSGDLVEPRRQLRVPFAITMGSIVAIIVGAGFFEWTESWLYSVYMGSIFLFMLFFNLSTFPLHRDSPQVIDQVEEPPATPANSRRVSDNDKDKPLVDRVHHVMESKRLYAQTGLTIGMLASSVSMQEYRLRRLINQKLHYRNFNQYLNQYRIAEAARRLQDPAEITLPISSIALDVGYASLSSFNKAFKEVHGVTPSIYRSRAPQ
ncbi:MAG: helix-turn-helix transcriptional regulator [Pseudomonadota bacterium]